MIVNGEEVDMVCQYCHIEVYGHTSFIQGEKGLIICTYCHQPVVSKEWYEKYRVANRLQLYRSFSNTWLSVKVFILYKYYGLQSWWASKRAARNERKGLDRRSK